MKTRQAIIPLVFLINTFNFPVYAGQVYFDISHDRSVNIDVKDDKKQLSILGDEIVINKKGRLWLSGNENSDGHHEILCQNRTEAPVTLKLDSDQSPWVKIADQPNCDNWEKDLLVCSVGDMEKGLFCKISKKAKPVAPTGKEKRTASVAVRSVSLLQEVPQPGEIDYAEYLKETIANYSTGIELCGIMNEQNGPVEITWIIYDGGNTGDIKINNKSTYSSDMDTANCIADQIKFWRFPEWKKNYRVSYRF